MTNPDLNHERKKSSQEEIQKRYQKFRGILLSKKGFEHIVENSSNHIQITDRNGILHYINHVADEFDLEDVLGSCVYDLIDEPSKEKFPLIMSEVLDNRISKQAELSDMYGNSYLMQFHPFDDENALITSVNITEIKKIKKDLLDSEKRLISAISHAPIPIILHDESGNIEFINKVWTELSGYSIEEIPTIDAWVKLVYEEESQERITTGIEKLFELEESIYEGAFEIITKWGEKRIWDFFSAPIGQKSDGSKMITSMAVDITDKVKMEEKEKEMQEKLIQTQKLESLGLLAGGIAHDFNNLLTGILGNINLSMEDPKLSKKTSEYLKRAEKITIKASDLVKQMLTYSGRTHIDKKPMDINSLIMDLKEFLRLTVPNNIQIEFDLHEGELIALIDQSQLEQVINNLVNNASEAYNDNNGTITISSQEKELTMDDLEEIMQQSPDMTPGRYVIIEIRDEGKGIPSQDLSLIFDPFYSSKGMGRGLGLSVVLGIILGHNGALDVQTESGVGTMFSIYLPSISKPAKYSVDIPEKSVPDKISVEKVIILDDEVDVLNVTAGMIETLGIETVKFTDPEEAVRFYTDNWKEISLVISDYTMKKMSGKEVFFEFSQINENLKMIIMSGYLIENIQLNEKQSDKIKFLQKPFSLSQFKQFIESI